MFVKIQKKVLTGFIKSQTKLLLKTGRRKKVANRNSGAWHGATENGPSTMDKSQTPTSYE
jgi:hypothetical protein